MGCAGLILILAALGVFGVVDHTVGLVFLLTGVILVVIGSDRS